MANEKEEIEYYAEAFCACTIATKLLVCYIVYVYFVLLIFRWALRNKGTTQNRMKTKKSNKRRIIINNNWRNSNNEDNKNMMHA